MTSSARSRPRWPLHPLTAAVGLLVLAGVGVLALGIALHQVAAASGVLILVAVAGAAAGFANSGST